MGGAADLGVEAKAVLVDTAAGPAKLIVHTYDVLIIGAGHNGLVTAAHLARVGLRVLVLECRELVGGACVTEELWPGFKVSTAAYVNSLLRSEIARDLDLKLPPFECRALMGTPPELIYTPVDRSSRSNRYGPFRLFLLRISASIRAAMELYMR